VALHESSELVSDPSPLPGGKIPRWAKWVGWGAIVVIFGSSLWRDIPYFLGYRKPSLDYSELAASLQQKDWEAADVLTTQLLMELAQIERNAYMEPKRFHRIPCADLKALDELWLQASNGHFGLSVQRDILLSLQVEIQSQYPDDAVNQRGIEIMNRFTDRVEQSLSRRPVENPPIGHFPSFTVLMQSDSGSPPDGFVPFATPEVSRRIAWCQL